MTPSIIAVSPSQCREGTRRSLQFLVFSLCIIALTETRSHAQHSQMFCRMVEREISGKPLCFFAIPPGGPQREIGLVTADPTGLTLLSLVHEDSLTIARQLRLTGSARSARFFEGNPAGTARYAVLSGEGDTVRLVRARKRSVEISSLPLYGRADGILCADIDSDGQREVITYGRRVAGLSILQHEPGGAMRRPEPLFPEISAADAAVLDVDGDGVNDVLMLDWLNDRLIYFQGIGRGTFSEPSAVDLPGEPGNFSVQARGDQLWIAITIPTARQIVVLTRDTTDLPVLWNSCIVPWEPDNVQIRDVNGDGRPDIVTSGGDEVAVLLSGPGKEYRRPVRFAAPGGGTHWMLEDIDGDKLPDLLVADTDRRSVIAATHAVQPLSRTRSTYFIGRGPADVMITEATGDRKNDLVVTSKGALTVYSQIAGRGFDPLASVEIPDDARRTSKFAGGTHPRFLVSYPHSEEIAAVALSGEPPVVRFPAGGDPTVILTGVDPPSSAAWILARCRPGARKEYALSIFEQMNERQYLERRMGGGVSSRALAVAARQAAGILAPMVLVASHDLAERAIVILAYTLGPRGDPEGEGLVATLRDTLGRFSWLQAEDLDHDGKLDLIIGLQRPTQRIGIVYGQGRPATTQDLVILEGSGVPEERWIESGDLDGDGLSDLVLCVDGGRTIEVAYGTGPRSFATSRTPVWRGEVAAFAEGPLFNRCDLVVAEPRGAMTVIQNPFVRTP